MKAYGYAAGAAQVDYEWAAKPDCKDEGKGSFEQPIEKDAVVVVGTIPKDLENVKIKLTSAVDIDIQLFDAVDGTAIVQWPDGLLKGEGKQSVDYAGFKVVWSGYNGDGTGKGNEYIEIIGKTSKSLVMKVFGYEAGTARVDYSWGGASAAQPVEADVIFAPAQRHEDKVVERIAAAQFSIDIAMYNMKHTGVFNALRDAIAQRNVKVRVIYQGAQKDRKDPAGTRSAKMEDLGIDVRYATKSKVMHHKFMIVDGPRRGDDGKPVLDRANTGWLVSGSGNWAMGNHDENTLFMRGVPELVLHFQNEFNRLWTWSWDFEWKSFSKDEAAKLDPTSFVDAPDQACFFTSANMKENITFTVDKSKEVVGEAIAAALRKAETSIEIASGHMRSETVYDALVEIQQNKPGVKIRVYLDGQEYTTSSYKDYYGYRLHAAGVPVKFKYYAYRWDYTYAPQMHNKYFIIDGKKVLSGSYNLSDNAEWNSLENVIAIEGDAFKAVVAKYGADFERLWGTDADGSKLSTLENKVKTYSSIPLVFSAMALTHPQIKALKVLIEDNCPQAWKGDNNYCSSDAQCDTARGLSCSSDNRCVNPLYDPDFGKNPGKHKSCKRL
jgi:phosphatidylserine/phosphatidylglycerophosphate/cardiolipin synthase-like enzyme